MVGMATTFGSADYSTPHGGQPFHYWKKGFGFGHGRGPGNHVQDPSVPSQLRFTPGGDRTFASTPFWRRKYEIGQAFGFGIGDRPDLSTKERDGTTVAPPDYGDVSKCLSKVRRNTTKRGISLKPRYPTMEERYKDMSWPECGPGPGKYNTCIEAGQSSWSYPSSMPSWTCGARGIPGSDIREQMAMPGPTAYEVRSKPGHNYPIRRGTLYDVAFRGRVPQRDVSGDASPGPARYNLNGRGGIMPKHGQPLDEYGLWAKIANVKVPGKVDHNATEGATIRAPESRWSSEEEEIRERFFAQVSQKKVTLARVESSPM